MDWVRGAVIGRGSSGVVHLAFRRDCSPETFAVKSAPLSSASLIKREEAIITDLQGCPHIIACFGHDITIEPSYGGNNRIFNIFLEYASGGSISNTILCAGGALPELTVRRHLRSILLGLQHVHSKGYAHYDIKPQNILLCEGEVKIADFGLAKAESEEEGDVVRGTPMYMAPESVAANKCMPASDIWTVGCTVVEMFTGRPPWQNSNESKIGIWPLLQRIVAGDEVPCIPPWMSVEGKDFLRCFFVKEPANRWTAEMLLSHPFIASFSG